MKLSKEISTLDSTDSNRIIKAVKIWKSYGLFGLIILIEKIEQKHKVRREEVEEVFSTLPYIRFVEKGHRKDENAYFAMRQTSSGRYLIIFFIYKKDKSALILSARDMTQKERKQYAKR